MQVLKRILEEIDSEIEKQKGTDESLVGTPGWRLYVKTMEQAKGIIRKHMNDGWIPVEERLPDEYEKVLVWYEYYRFGAYNCMYESYGIGYQYDGRWSGDVQGVNARSIAWQPLPEPYKPERKTEDACKPEELTGWKAKMLKTFCKCE